MDLNRNIIDLTEHQNNSIVVFAKQLFSKNVNNLDIDKAGLFLDDTMETADIFCMMIELFLYGLNILLPNKTIFDLDNDQNPIVDVINKYFRSFGIKLILEEVYLIDDIHTQMRNSEYYCVITQNIISSWSVLNYKIQINFNSIQRSKDNQRVLKDFIAYFISTDNKLFSISFDYKLV